MGSLNVFNACAKNHVNTVIFISTDKACLPVNAYGACKFISEKIFTNYNPSNVKTKFITVRYGNVLESTGSVIPFFTNKIKNGEDIPLTDERMTRFIIDKQEAVALIFDAVRHGIGGEIFVKKLPSFKIVDLIEILKEKYNAHNNIKVIGLRPGEKIHELLLNESEMFRTYFYEDFFVILPTVSYGNIEKHIEPSYILHGHRLSIYNHNQISSENAVVSKESIIKIFNQIGLL